MAKKTVAQKIRAMTNEELVRARTFDMGILANATNNMVKDCAAARIAKIECELARRDVEAATAPPAPAPTPKKKATRRKTAPKGGGWTDAILQAMERDPHTRFTEIANSAAAIRGCELSGGAYVAMQKLIKDGLVVKDGKTYTLKEA